MIGDIFEDTHFSDSGLVDHCTVLNLTPYEDPQGASIWTQMCVCNFVLDTTNRQNKQNHISH